MKHGYRALAIESGGNVQLRSWNDKDFNARCTGLVETLESMPDDTVLDGEVRALDEEGRPSFNALQNRSHGEPLHRRRSLLDRHVLPTPADPIRYSPILAAILPNLIRSIKEQGLEGLVAKRRNSKYEPGERSGAWRKMRVNRSEDFEIGGYTIGRRHFDALIFGYWEGDRLMYAARTRSGFTPAVREQLHQRFQGLETPECPFANLPEARAGRWGEGLTAAKMKQCRWVRPVLLGQFEFVEWTPDKHLRHSRFVGLREDTEHP